MVLRFLGKTVILLVILAILLISLVLSILF